MFRAEKDSSPDPGEEGLAILLISCHTSPEVSSEVQGCSFYSKHPLLASLIEPKLPFKAPRGNFCKVGLTFSSVI